MGLCAVLIAAAMGVAGCNSPTSSPAESIGSTSTAMSVSAPPNLISVPIAIAETTHPDITIEAVDLGPGIIDGVDQRRAIDNKATWRISAQCDQMVGGTLKVGAFKEAEYQMLVTTGSGESTANNALKVFLDCP